MSINPSTPYFFRQHQIDSPDKRDFAADILQVGDLFACRSYWDFAGQLHILDMAGKITRTLPSNCGAECYRWYRSKIESLGEYLLFYHCCTTLRMWNLDPTLSPPPPPKVFHIGKVEAIKKIDANRLAIVANRCMLVYEARTDQLRELGKCGGSIHSIDISGDMLCVLQHDRDCKPRDKNLRDYKLNVWALRDGTFTQSAFNLLSAEDEGGNHYWSFITGIGQIKLIGNVIAFDIYSYCRRCSIISIRNIKTGAHLKSLICDVPNDQWQRTLQEKPILALQSGYYNRRITALFAGANHTLAAVEHAYTHFWDLKDLKFLSRLDQGGASGEQLTADRFALLDDLGVIRIVDLPTQSIVQVLDYSDKTPIGWGVMERIRRVQLARQLDVGNQYIHKKYMTVGRSGNKGHWRKFLLGLPLKYRVSHPRDANRLLIHSTGKVIRIGSQDLQIWSPPRNRGRIAIDRIRPINLQTIPIDDPSFDLNLYRAELTQLAVQQRLQNQRIRLGESLEAHPHPQVREYHSTLRLQLQGIFFVLQLIFSGWVKNEMPVANNKAEHRLHGMEHLPHQAHEFIEALDEIAEAFHGERVLHALHQANMPLPFLATILFALSKIVSFRQNKERRQRMAILKELVSLIRNPEEIADMIAINATRSQIPFLEALPLHQPERRLQGIRDFWARFTAHEHLSPAEKLALCDASTIIMRYIAERPEMTRYDLVDTLGVFIPERYAEH